MRDGLFSFGSFALLGALGLAAGCQKGEPTPEGMPELYPASVTILQEGVPLANASIRILPENGTSRWSSGGSTDASGVAVLRTHGKFEGVPAGSYKMTVSKIEMPDLPKVELSQLDAPPATDGATYDLVAPEYSYPNQTPLRLEVAAGPNTYEPFDLGPAVRVERQGPPTQ